MAKDNTNKKRTIEDVANDHRDAMKFYDKHGDTAGVYYVAENGCKIELKTKSVYSPEGAWLYTPSGVNIFKGEYERFIEALYVIEQYQIQKPEVVDVQTPIGKLNVTVIGADLFAFEKNKEYPDYHGNSKAFLVGDVVYYEQFTCHSGYSGTCNCFSHPRRKWWTYKIDGRQTYVLPKKPNA